ncbi:hypothetical protein C8R44DRAFT_808667 [Mycena epipterygia]|nr:hypothetical protein C8R44DRAFT_808667 [Mycena epipterygia]
MTQYDFERCGPRIYTVFKELVRISLRINWEFPSKFLLTLLIFLPVQVWVDAWHANATGFYAGYIAETGSSISSGGAGGGMSNSSMSMSGSMSGFGGAMGSQTGASGAASTASATYGATSGADSTNAIIQLDTTMDDNNTFLRGVF